MERKSPSDYFPLAILGAACFLAASNPQRKEGKLHIMKYIALIALAAMAIGFGGCAKEPAPAPAPASHGMSK
jgi:hypothetical protein